MTHKTIFLAVIGVVLGGGFLVGPRPILAGEHFLAIDVPKGMHKQIKHRQDKIDALLQAYRDSIKDEHKKKAIHVRTHSPDNLHISLMRFDHIPHSKLHTYKKAIRHAVTDHLHQFDMADKVDHATLHVTDDGYVVYRVKPSKRLTTFMEAVASELSNKHLDHGKPDTPGHLHISIARVEGISADKLRKLLDGHVGHLECSHFPVHDIHLKVSHEPDKHLHYTNVGSAFHVPKAKK